MALISDLEVFARVVMVGNMSAAGRDMGLSPAVVSKRISQLEKRLGARLIQRTTRKLTLTETGQGFYDRIVGVLEGIQAAEAYVTSDHIQPKGILRITAPNAFGRVHIASKLPKFMEKYPDLKVYLHLSDQVVDLVGQVLDIGIRIFEGDKDNSSMVLHRLAPNRRVICASPEYLDRHGRPETLAELSKHNCLTEEDDDTWKLQGPKGAVNFKATGTITTNSNEVVREAALAGAGICWRSTWDFGDDIKQGRLEEILPEYTESPNLAMFAVYPSREFVPAKLKVFIEFMEKEIGSPVPYWDKGLKLGRDARVSSKAG